MQSVGVQRGADRVILERQIGTEQRHCSERIFIQERRLCVEA